MKKYVLLAALALPVAAFAQQGFKISGKIGESHKPILVFFQHAGRDEKPVVDSAVVTNGTFSFTGSVAEPQSAILAVRYEADKGPRLKDVFAFYVENTGISINAPDSIRYATVTGSVINDENQQLKATLKPLVKQNVRLNTELNRAEKANPDAKNEPGFQAKSDSLKKIQAEMAQIRLKYVQTHPDTYFSLLTFDIWFSLYGQSDTKEAQQLFNGFTPTLKSSDLGTKLAKTISLVSQRQIGTPAPDFTQPGIDGKPFTLSSLRGKYVLLDFWASWCVPCRAENPNVVKAYNELKNKNFEVVSVSLDTKHDDWVKAIQKDGMPWIHVSDLKGFKDEVAVQFYITAIPQNFLIDPNGIIIASDLRGDDLDKQLAKFIK